MLSLESAGPALRVRAYGLRVLAALYSVGDGADAADAVDRQSRRVAAPLSEDPAERQLQYEAICPVEQWRLWAGDTRSISRSLEKLRRADPDVDPPGAATRAWACTLLLEAIRGHVDGAVDAEVRVARLDSVMRTVPQAPQPRGWSYGNLALSRLREARGDLEGALDAAWRIPHLWWSDVYLSRHLYEEGRLSELLGQPERAIRAYRHYLALHHDPEPALEAEVESVRPALSRLGGGPAGPGP